jgi:hypothetical protein
MRKGLPTRYHEINCNNYIMFAATNIELCRIMIRYSSGDLSFLSTTHAHKWQPCVQNVTYLSHQVRLILELLGLRIHAQNISAKEYFITV